MSPITKRNIVQHELIGLYADVVGSPHFDYLKIQGRIIDETKNTLLMVNSEGRKKRVPKTEVVLHISIPDGSTVEVDGKIIVGRPIDRVKKRVRRKKLNG